MRSGRLRILISAVWGLALMIGCADPGPKPGELPPVLTDRQPADTAGAGGSAPAQSSAGNAPGPKDADAPAEFTKTPSGLEYRILRKSDGRKPTATDSVTVHYRGWLDNGTEFDSSYRRGESTSFPLTGVIRAWTEGLQLVGEGGMIELQVPSELGYGAEGSGGTIPPNATLHFLVELLKVR